MSKLDDLVAKIKREVEVKRKGDRVIIDSPKIRRDHAAEAALKDPALKALYAAANAKAREMLERPVDPYAGWIELARVTLIGRQLCRTCGAQHDYVAAELLKLQGYAPRGLGVEPLRTTVMVRRPSANPNLPDEVRCLDAIERVDRCPDCSTLGAAIDSAIDTAFNGHDQGRLFS
jgi:hypothetical protein